MRVIIVSICATVLVIAVGVLIFSKVGISTEGLIAENSRPVRIMRCDEEEEKSLDEGRLRAVLGGYDESSVNIFSLASYRDPRIVKNEHGVLYMGAINFRGLEKLTKALKSSAKRRLIIASGGGIERAAAELAKFIADEGIEVQIVGKCLSACAIYIPPSAKSLIVDGVIGFHGSALRCMREDIETSGKLSYSGKRLIESAAQRQRIHSDRYPVFGRLLSTADDAYTRLLRVSAQEVWVVADQEVLRAAVPGVEIGADFEKYMEMFIRSGIALGSAGWKTHVLSTISRQ